MKKLILSILNPLTDLKYNEKSRFEGTEMSCPLNVSIDRGPILGIIS